MVCGPRQVRCKYIVAAINPFCICIPAASIITLSTWLVGCFDVRLEERKKD